MLSRLPPRPLSERTPENDLERPCRKELSRMDASLLNRAIALLGKKVNFRCSKETTVASCGKCSSVKSCDRSYLTWTCYADFRQLREALSELGVTSQEEYIKFVESNGGYCDCEVVFNVKLCEGLRKELRKGKEK